MKRFNSILMYSSFILLIVSIILRITVGSSHGTGFPEIGSTINFENLLTQNGQPFSATADTTIVIAYNTNCGTCQSLAPSWKWIAEGIRSNENVEVIGLSLSTSEEIIDYRTVFSLPFSTLLDDKGRFHRRAGILVVPQIIWLHGDRVVNAIRGEIATDILVEQYLNTDTQ